VLGIKDKMQVIVEVSSYVVGLLLPLQVIFIGTTPRTLPPNNQRNSMCVANRWDFTYSENR